MAISIQWNDVSTGRTVDSQGVTSERKQVHAYKGFLAYRDRTYETLWGPILDSNGHIVDGLPGLWNLGNVERAIDGYLADKAIRDRAKQDAIARFQAPPAEEPSEITEQPADNTPPITPAVVAYREVTDNRERDAKHKADGGY
jgi:hypothetical protein